MKERTLLLNILALSVVALFLIAGTYAYFTASTSTSSNLFQTGTVTLGTEPTSAAFNVQHLAPGATEAATIAVRNEGSLDVTYRISAEKKKGYSVVFNALTVQITDVASGRVHYDGPLSQLAAGPIALGAGSANGLRFVVGLPAETANDLQSNYCVVDFNFDAEQAH